MGKRILYLDSAGAILLIYMIIGHCCQWSHTFDIYFKYTYWLNFFMPWFFFKAGMFFRNRPVKEEIKKSFRRLIVPYIVFTIVGTTLLWIKQIIEGDLSFNSLMTPLYTIIKYGAAPGNLALWFLPSLFVVRVLFVFIYRKIGLSYSFKRKLLWGGVFMILILSYIPLSYSKESFGIKYPLYFSNISSGLMYYWIGYTLRNYLPQWWHFFILSLIYIVLMFYFPVCVDMRTGDLIEGNLLLWIPVSVIGILLINSLCKFLFNSKNVLSYIGNNMMPYYCMHWCVIIIVSIFFISKDTYPNIPFLIALIISNLVSLPLLTYLIDKTRFSYIYK